jgi:thiamine-monophosphate kinase
LGEAALLARIIPLLPAGRGTWLGPGDDAAVLAFPDGRAVVTTDVLVEGRHFRRDWSQAADVGWRAAQQNLADVVAMGARPLALVVALALPPATPAVWAEGLARGLAEACRPWDVGVVGGDLSAGSEITVAVTALGDLEGRAPVTRGGARAGHRLALAGQTGWSAAGHAALAAGWARDGLGPGGGTERRGSAGGGEASAGGARAGVGGAGRPASHAEGGVREVARRAIGLFLRPDSPLGAGIAAAQAGATAMLDVSDGLVRDGARLAAASGVTVDLDPAAAGLAGPLAALGPLAGALGADAREWVLAGGEDHALLAAFPPGAALPAGFAWVGRVLEPGPGGARRAGGLSVGGTPWTGGRGWDHFER